MLKSLPSKDQINDKASVQAHIKVARDNRRGIARDIRNAKAEILGDFFIKNFEVLEEYVSSQNKFGDADLDELLDTLRSGTTEESAKARSKLLEIANSFTSQKNFDFKALNGADIGFEPRDISKVQKEFATRKLRFVEGIQSSFSSVIRALKATTYLAYAPLSFSAWVAKSIHNGIHSLGDVVGAAERFLGMKTWQRNAVNLLTTAGLVASAIIPQSTSSYAALFLGNKVSLQDDFHPACQDPRILGGDRLTAAFAIALYPKNDKMRPHYIAALQSLKFGLSPIDAYLTSMRETGRGHDVRADKSSATGAFQTVLGKKLDDLRVYGKKIPAYTEAKKRLENPNNPTRDEDAALVSSFDKIIADYRANPKSVLKAFKDNIVPLTYHTAIQYSDNPVISGQLFAAHLEETRPEFKLENIENATMEEITAFEGKSYQPHLLGAAGSKFLDYVIEHAPETKMNDILKLASLYRAYNPGSDNADYFSKYYSRIASTNRVVFKKGANVTALQFQKDIARFVGEWAKSDLQKIEIARNKGNNAAMICANDQARIAMVIPAEASRLRIAYTVAGNLVRNYAPEEIHTATSWIGHQFANTSWTFGDKNTTTEIPANDRNGITRLIEDQAIPFNPS